MEEEKKDVTVKTKNNKVLVFIAIAIFTVFALTFSLYGYAKFVDSANGTLNANIADLFCRIEVVKHDTGDGSINPYCDVTVRNYGTDTEGHDRQSKVDFDFTIEVIKDTSAGDFNMPAYYWQKMDATGTVPGDIIARSPAEGETGEGPLPLNIYDFLEYGNTPVGGEKTVGQMEKKYRIVFINPGDKDIIRKIKFKVIATDKKDEGNTQVIDVSGD